MTLQDVRLQNSGKPARYTAEVERDLDKADGMIRLLFNDVQFLKDGRHLQAEQIYRRSDISPSYPNCQSTNWDFFNLILFKPYCTISGILLLDSLWAKVLIVSCSG